MTDSATSAQAGELMQALEHHRAGRTPEAAAIYRRLIVADPANADALHLLGTITAQAGDAIEAERLIAAALKIKPDMAQMWSNYGNVLAMLGRRAEAIASYDKAIALQPSLVDAIYNRGGHLITSGRIQEALTAAELAIAAAAPDAPGRHILMTGKGNALLALERYGDAIAVYNAVLAIAPRNIDAMANRGIALKQIGRHGEAIAVFENVLAVVPGHVDAILGRAHAQVLIGQIDAPLAMMDKVIAVQPDNALAHYIRGHALLAGFRTGDALVAFQSAAAAKPDYVEALYNVAEALRQLVRYPEAIPAYQRVLALDPTHAHALSGLADVAMQCCDWEAVAKVRPLVEENVRAGRRGMMPFSFLTLSQSKELHLACTRAFTRHNCPSPVKMLTEPGRHALAHERIRIGYLSADFRRHATAFHVAELFEIHDRDRFEVIGFSAYPDDGSPLRRRIEKSFDSFHDVAKLTNEQIARMMHQCGIDVAVDLNGHTAYSRIGALAWRPAPVQATYLGFPGTCGAGFIDYAITDETVAPFSDQDHYTERIVHLPGCYQVSDRTRKAAAYSPGRAAHGLPDDAFVFCCFNTSYKFSAEMFAVWMRLLNAVPRSVLWLLRGNAAMMDNLRRAADAHGVAPGRLVFCDLVEPDQHLARHALADLFLDTLPYNSHTTGNFALWAGLPMVACAGETFASRVSLSMLRAIGLPELAVASLEEYEALALKLARDRAALADIKRRLAANRDTAPLFDTDLFRQHIEAAYTTMLEIAQRGEPPRSFAVAPLR